MMIVLHVILCMCGKEARSESVWYDQAMMGVHLVLGVLQCQCPALVATCQHRPLPTSSPSIASWAGSLLTCSRRPSWNYSVSLDNPFASLLCAREHSLPLSACLDALGTLDPSSLLQPPGTVSAVIKRGVEANGTSSRRDPGSR
jgi:hypothetical protein